MGLGASAIRLPVKETLIGVVVAICLDLVARSRTRSAWQIRPLPEFSFARAYAEIAPRIDPSKIRATNSGRRKNILAPGYTGVGGNQILLDDPSGNPIELFQHDLVAEVGSTVVVSGRVA